MQKCYVIWGLCVSVSLFFMNLNAHAADPITPESYQSAVRGMEGRFAKLYESPPKFFSESTEQYPAIQGDRVFTFLEQLTEFSYDSRDQGDVLWGRVQGSNAERLATEWVATKFRDWSLQDVKIEQFPLTAGSWRPTSMSLTALNEDGTTRLELVSAATAYPSGQTPEKGLVAPIEYVGLGTPADLKKVDLEGKIALLYVRTFNGALLHSGLSAAARIAYTTKAAGIILWMDLPGNAQLATQLFTPNGFIDHIPWTSIGFQDGFYLRQLVEGSEAPPKVNLTVRGIIAEGTSQNLIGVLPGSSDENIVITGHIDGYWGAILDNGTGIASLMELARYYSLQPKESRKRNLVFLVTGDHELNGAGGSYVFAEKHPEIMEKSVLFLQLEHLVAPNTGNSLNLLQTANGTSPLSLFVSNGSSAVIDQFRTIIEDYGLTVSNSVQLNTAGDVDGIQTVPSAGFIQTGHYYHSSDDVLALYQPEDLAHVTKAHAALIDKLMELPAESIGSQREAAAPIYAAEEMQSVLAPW